MSAETEEAQPAPEPQHAEETQQPQTDPKWITERVERARQAVIRELTEKHTAELKALSSQLEELKQRYEAERRTAAIVRQLSGKVADIDLALSVADRYTKTENDNVVVDVEALLNAHSALRPRKPSAPVEAAPAKPDLNTLLREALQRR